MESIKNPRRAPRGVKKEPTNRSKVSNFLIGKKTPAYYQLIPEKTIRILSQLIELSSKRTRFFCGLIMTGRY
ncbi:hypothetical protein ES708_05011 [subsurface metagenome]